MPKKILVVDDDFDILETCRDYLKSAGYEAIAADDGLKGLALARREKPDLIVLDLMLPGMDGLEVCRALRKSSDVPIIMITARGEEIDRVVGLELGADDYVSKPFSVRELMARIKAVLRRVVQPEQKSTPTGAHLAGKGGLQLDPESRQVTVAETILPLTRLEFDLFSLLLSNAGRVLTRERLLEQAWGYDFIGDTRAVDSAIKRLRAKLRAANPEADSIEAVRGVGYRLKP